MCNQPNSHTEESLLCSEDEVCHLLLTLDVTKSSGPDGISTAMLKHTADTIALSLYNKDIQPLYTFGSATISMETLLNCTDP